MLVSTWLWNGSWKVTAPGPTSIRSPSIENTPWPRAMKKVSHSWWACGLVDSPAASTAQAAPKGGSTTPSHG